MNIGMITCTYFMRIYDYNPPVPFNWGAMCDKYRMEFGAAEFLKLAAEIRAIGFNSMEIWEPMFSHKVYNHDMAQKIAGELRRMGFQNLVYCIGGWGAGDVPSIDAAYAFARAMGCKVVTGCVTKADAAAVLPALQAAGDKYDMLYAIENHPAPSIESPEDVDVLCRPYPRVGANLDTGIYNMMGYDVLAAADLLKDKIFHCHFKDSPRGGEGCLPIGDADTPCAELLAKFRAWDYQYMVSVEYEFPTDPAPGLYKSLGYIGGVLKTLEI
ncbi:MAG: sugar phosphate isomerase/epimerase [Clostridiales bacterium]|nr:sugar phosphate isomerase/epimerase [Clostridiales bacterium]